MWKHFFDHFGFIAFDSRVFSHINHVITGQKEVRNTKKTVSKSCGEDVSYAANLEGRNGDTHPDGVLRHKDILCCSWVTNGISNLSLESDWILLPLMRVEFPTWLRVSIKCAESYFEPMVYILRQIRCWLVGWIVGTANVYVLKAKNIVLVYNYQEMAELSLVG